MMAAAVVAVADDYALLDAGEPGCRRRARTQRHRPAQVLPKVGRGGAILSWRCAFVS